MIGSGPNASLKLEVGFNRDNDVAQYEAGNDVLVANITPGKVDTENNLIICMYGVAESYSNNDNYGFANGADLGVIPTQTVL